LSGHAAIDKPARRRWLQLVPPDIFHAENWCCKLPNSIMTLFSSRLIAVRMEPTATWHPTSFRRGKSKHSVKSINRGGSLEGGQEAWLFSFKAGIEHDENSFWRHR
jgi:hypothetical protein